MNSQLEHDVATLINKYIPYQHFKQRMKIAEELDGICQRAYADGYAAHRDYVMSKSFWWRLYYVF